MPQTLQSLAKFISARLIGDEQIEVSRVASIAGAQPGDLVFVQSDKHLADALASKASAVIAGEFAANEKAAKPLLIAANPRLAFATAASLLHAAPEYRPEIHATAVIHPSAKVSPSASVDAYAVIEPALLSETARTSPPAATSEQAWSSATVARSIRGW